MDNKTAKQRKAAHVKKGLNKQAQQSADIGTSEEETSNKLKSNKNTACQLTEVKTKLFKDCVVSLDKEHLSANERLRLRKCKSSRSKIDGKNKNRSKKPAVAHSSTSDDSDDELECKSQKQSTTKSKGGKPFFCLFLYSV